MGHPGPAFQCHRSPAEKHHHHLPTEQHTQQRPEPRRSGTLSGCPGGLRLNVGDDGDRLQSRHIENDAYAVDLFRVVAQQGAGHLGAQLEGLTLIATIARSRRCVWLAVSLDSSVSAGSTVMTRERRCAWSGDTGLLVRKAGEVGIAGRLPRHPRSRATGSRWRRCPPAPTQGRRPARAGRPRTRGPIRRRAHRGAGGRARWPAAG